MFEAFIRFLIAIVVVAICVFLLIWVLGAIGIHLPYKVEYLLYVLAGLVCLLFLYRLFSPYWGEWWPKR